MTPAGNGKVAFTAAPMGFNGVWELKMSAANDWAIDPLKATLA